MENATLFPFRLSLQKAKYIAPLISEEFTLILVLKGSVHVRIDENDCELVSDDMLVINPLQQYQLESSEKNLFLSIQFSRKPIIVGTNEILVPDIACCSAAENGDTDAKEFYELRKSLIHLMGAYFNQDKTNEMEIYQHFFTVLSLLIKFFKKEEKLSPQFATDIKNHWLNELLIQIQKKYDHPLTLEELARTNDISYSHLSRTFKKIVGITFTEYITQIRLSHAVEELLLTKQPIIKIAMNNGFSNTKNFHQVFKKKYELTPANYRKKFSDHKKNTNTDNKKMDWQKIVDTDALKELGKYLVETDIEDVNPVINQEQTINIPREKLINYKSGKKIVKIGLASEGLASGVKHELRLLQRELSFDLVQFEGFCEETNFFEEVTLVSEYVLNNQWFDFLLEIQLKPMIQFRLPEQCEAKDDIKKWCDKQLKIMRHFLNRYGLDEVSGWYVEWIRSINKDSVDKELWAYHYLYEQLKLLIPMCSIGLLSISTFDEKEFESYANFMEKQRIQGKLPDFISFQADPYASASIRDKQATRFKEYQKEMLIRVQTEVNNTQEKLADRWQPELFLTEWNTLVGEGSVFSGTFFRSALILESILDFYTKVDGIAFWVNVKVKERRTCVREDNSLSIFLYEELRRPLFFSLRFLNHLNGELISKGKGYILTRNQNQLQLLLYNSSYLDPAYSVDTIQVQYQTKKMTIELEGIKAGDYLIREYVLDKDHGGIYNDWVKVGGQVEIDLELQRYLEQKISPKFELNKVFIESNEYTVNSTLTLNACKLYLFQPIY